MFCNIKFIIKNTSSHLNLQKEFTDHFTLVNHFIFVSVRVYILPLPKLRIYKHLNFYIVSSEFLFWQYVVAVRGKSKRILRT